MRARSPWLIALLHPLNWLMLISAVGAGLLAAWWLFPLGVGLWLVMVLSVAREPALQLNHQLQQRAPLAQRFQTYYDRIERAQLSIFHNLAGAPPRMRRILTPIQTEVEALAAQTYDLCHRMTALENYRKVAQSRSNLLADLQRINLMLENATDAYIKKEYAESKHALEERLDKLQAITQQLDRVEAQLLSLANDMDSTVSQLLRMQALPPGEAEKYAPGLAQQLYKQSAELTTFEQNIIHF